MATALRRPHWAPYLGRRSCPPDEPFLLRSHTPDPEEELLTRVPLSRPAPTGNHADTVGVEFLREHPPFDDVAAPADSIDINDIPVSFSPTGAATEHAGCTGAWNSSPRPSPAPSTPCCNA
ncbi:type I-E CRISPR-associated protein Cas5/CasD [Streptomyces mexicanus]